MHAPYAVACAHGVYNHAELSGKTALTGTDIKKPIPCLPVNVDPDVVSAAIARPGRDAYVDLDNGELTAYVTPGSAQPARITADLCFLDQYLVLDILEIQYFPSRPGSHRPMSNS